MFPHKIENISLNKSIVNTSSSFYNRTYYYKLLVKRKIFSTAMHWIFVSPAKFMCWVLTPSVMVSGGAAVGRCRVHKGRSSWMDQCPIKGTPEGSRTPTSHVSTQWEGRGPHWPQPGRHWPWTSQPSELWEISICCSQATSLWYRVTAAQTDYINYIQIVNYNLKYSPKEFPKWQFS